MKLPQKKIMESLKSDDHHLMVLVDMKKFKKLNKEHLVTDASGVVNLVYESLRSSMDELSKELGLNVKIKTILTITE